jgi:hypothetical protein
VTGFDYDAKPEGRLEIPVGERIAAHRARRAGDRTRRQTRARRRNHPPARRGSKRNAGASS